MEKVPQYNEREPSAQAMTDQEMTPDKETLRPCKNNPSGDAGYKVISLNECVVFHGYWIRWCREHKQPQPWCDQDSLRAENADLKERKKVFAELFGKERQICEAYKLRIMELESTMERMIKNPNQPNLVRMRNALSNTKPSEGSKEKP